MHIYVCFYVCICHLYINMYMLYIYIHAERINIVVAHKICPIPYFYYISKLLMILSP